MPRKGLSCLNSTLPTVLRLGKLTPLALARHRAAPCSAWPLEPVRQELRQPH